MIAKEFIKNILEICNLDKIQENVSYLDNNYQFIDLTNIGEVFYVKSNNFKTYLIKSERKTSPEAYYCNMTFMIDTGHIMNNVSDLPNNIYEWSEEEYFYFSLKYPNV